MAGADGSAPDHLRSGTDHRSFLRAAAAEPSRWGYLALMRRAEALAPSLPRVGRSRLPSQNIADQAQEPAMAFPPPTVEAIEPAPGGRLRVRSHFLGLTGPMGALPLHLTEYAFYEKRMGENHPFGRWLDLLTDRMLQFFYRAWADTQPAAQADRPADDRFAAYVAALSGAGAPMRHETRFTAQRRLYYAGAFISRRSAAVIRDVLSHALRRPVRLQEFVARWRDVDPADRTRLGDPSRGGGYNALGVSTMLGSRVRLAEDAFRVTIRATGADDYRQLLPGQVAHEVAREVMDALKPSQLDWELELEMAEDKVPAARLDGQAPLGLMSWLAPKGRAHVIRADARMRA